MLDPPSSSDIFSRISSITKSVPRSQRAENRNRAKDELKRVINAVDKVRNWEKRWVMLQDSSISVYKWVPVSGSSSVVAPKVVTQQQKAVQKTEPNGVKGEGAAVANGGSSSTHSAENSTNDNEDTNVSAPIRAANEEDSNAPGEFSEGAFDSDSQTFDRVDYKRDGVAPTTVPTDFSTLRKEESGEEKREQTERPRKRARIE